MVDKPKKDSKLIIEGIDSKSGKKFRPGDGGRKE